MSDFAGSIGLSTLILSSSCPKATIAVATVAGALPVAALKSPTSSTTASWPQYSIQNVDRFYKRLNDFGTGEAASKIIERLQKNRNTMFTFLDFDGVPWNNNNAEHAVKAFATLRRVIGGSTTEEGLRDYLILLSLCETCKYKNVDFLEFLRSGTKDIDYFATNGRKQPVRGTGQTIVKEA